MPRKELGEILREADLVTEAVEPDADRLFTLGINDAQWRRFKEAFARESATSRQRTAQLTPV